MTLKQRFSELLPPDSILENEPMSRHTSFLTGGPADFLLLPQNEGQLRGLLQLLKSEKQPYFVMGKGSNLLVSDSGYRGAVVKINYGGVTVDGDILKADAGILLRAAAVAATGQGLVGLEFAAGIPGTLGGGVTMNAGAYDGELKDYVKTVRVLEPDGRARAYSNEEMRFSYRRSVVQENTALVVLSAEFQLPAGDIRASKRRIEQLAALRREKQPLEYPSAGSVFKRPPGAFAAALIQQSGLKNHRFGGAQVSGKHAGFIINVGNATSADIWKLMNHVRKNVFETTGVMLEPEIKLLGDFPDD